MSHTRFAVIVCVRRAAEEVFDFLTDAANNPLWQSGVLACRQDGPAAMGVRVHEQREVLGHRIEVCYELVRVDRPVAVEVRAVSGPVAFTASYRLRPRRGATEVTLEGAVADVTVPVLAGPLARAVAHRQLRADSARLKRVLERRTVAAASPTG